MHNVVDEAQKNNLTDLFGDSGELARNAIKAEAWSDPVLRQFNTTQKHKAYNLIKRMDELSQTPASRGYFW